MSNLRLEAEVKDNKKRLVKAGRRCDEVDGLIKKLYETYALGKLPENHFDRLLAEHDTEQSNLRQEMTVLQAQIDEYAADSVKADRFIEMVSQYTQFEQLTPTMLNEFVEKVVIHEGDKSGGKRTQQVDVYLNFIGNFDIAQALEEEPVIDLKAEEKRQKACLRQRLYRQRKKQSGPAA